MGKKLLLLTISLLAFSQFARLSAQTLGIFDEQGDPARLPFGNGQPDPLPGPGRP